MVKRVDDNGMPYFDEAADIPEDVYDSIEAETLWNKIKPAVGNITIVVTPDGCFLCTREDIQMIALQSWPTSDKRRGGKDEQKRNGVEDRTIGTS